MNIEYSSSLCAILLNTSYFLLLFLIFFYPSLCLSFHKYQNYISTYFFKTQSGYFWLNSSISKKANAVLIKVYKVIKYEVGDALKNSLIDELCQKSDNKTYLYKNLKRKSEKNSSNKDNYLNNGAKCKDSDTKIIIITTSSNQTKEMFIQIL